MPFLALHRIEKAISQIRIGRCEPSMTVPTVTLTVRLKLPLATVRQARLDLSAKAHRSPPEGWEDGVAGLAEMEGYRLLKLAKTLDKQAKTKK